MVRCRKRGLNGWSLRVGLTGTLLLASGCFRLGSDKSVPPPNAHPATTNILFKDVAAESGLDFTYEIPGKRPMNILQSMGGGAAFLDFDGDGNLDILLTSQKVALFKGDGKGKFADVTATALPALPNGFWMGIAIGDYDNDGFPDIYLSAYRGGVLLHNEAGKSFRDVTKEAGIPRQPWGSAAAFGDYDGDGRLDLFVGNYVQFGPNAVQMCKIRNIDTACSPTVYSAEKNVLYRNVGGGKFRDVTRQTGVSQTNGKALGVLFVDLEDSGRQSLFIGNDEVPADLLKNRGDGTFESIGESSGVAFLPNGSPYGAMGVDRGDVNGDGKIDLAVGTFAVEEKMIFINEGEGIFTDYSQRLGLNSVIESLTFGEKLFDFDNDGWLDLMMVNGYIADNVADYEPTRRYRQPTLLFRNEKGERFVNISDSAGDALKKPIVGRALAIGDYDNDGRLDALIADAEGQPLLLHNEAKAANYITLRLIGQGKSNRDAYGTRIEVEADGRKRLLYAHADGSYFSSSDSRVHIGLGSATAAKLTLRWPDGATQTLNVTEVNRQITLRENE